MERKIIRRMDLKEKKFDPIKVIEYLTKNNSETIGLAKIELNGKNRSMWLADLFTIS